MLTYIGNGPYCYANSASMLLESAGEYVEPRLIEILSGVGLGACWIAESQTLFAGSARRGLPTPHECVHHYPAYYKDRRGNHENDYPRPTHTRVLWLFGRWVTRPSLRSMPLTERVDVSLRLIKECSSTAYANGIATVSMITVVTIDDVLFCIIEGEPATAAGWWCGDVHFLVDSALPHRADLKANRGAVLRGVRRCIRVEGVSNRDDSPREDRRKLLQFFGRSPRLRTLTRVDLLGIPKEPEDTHHEREAHCGY